MIIRTNLKVKTKYNSLVPRGEIGTILYWSIDDYTSIVLVNVEFTDGECSWFLERDLEEADQ